MYYIFTWARSGRGGNNPRRNAGGEKPKGRGKPRKGGPRGDKGEKGGKAQNFSARPPRKEKQIDPDNPFAAALMGLKDNK